MLVPAHRPALYLPQQLSHMQRTGRRERGERRPDNLADTGGVHRDVWGGNKQADVSNEAGGFEHSEGIWVIPSDETLAGRLSCSITDTDEGD